MCSPVVEPIPRMRSSAPYHHLNRMSLEVEHQVLWLRRGPDWIVLPAGVSRHVPLPGSCTVATCLTCMNLDPVTGTVVRVSKITAVRYEHDHLGSRRCEEDRQDS